MIKLHSENEFPTPPDSGKAHKRRENDLWRR
jgi:hypothetical protein